MGETIGVEKRAGYAVVTLNRPDKLNAFNAEMHRELRAALDELGADDDCRAILLTGAGRGFCAGQDLGDRDPSKMDGPPDLGTTLENFYNPLVRRIRAMNKPVVCAVNGVAAGAGANIALACDIVLAAESAKFIQAFARLGLVPDAGGTWQLPRMIGEARAKALALTAEPLPAAKAAEWGLIWKSVADDALMAEATSLVESFAKGPTIGYALTKQAIQAAASNSLDEHLDLERDLQREAGRTPDYAEGVAAFLEKRPAKFTGRGA
ncbi:2-(1,2-epoxy-1,2-dihydrophenyl)acetyl-CoA isomerase PaaG [Microbaculum marinisediminis]|uniref:2-(1,2-epoxy-1,2-dihydrophenyl)acetyl-CoA isomerase PaaG n=1 Tax=Microbaculum marinisediminis TaxID=2931392 RepID=A0AAW5R0S0_9HYPH|nr:2-(1,2-epoxy-1,2-dihydrophenyl)acetyl-CoA isomerase PaaG [Microbaculum sp. A6E488]MCT8972734.1 2-(1,2-epoxy-1,2-dihydrophenyl)acetyl-CoA isomerase PaaG [Microbaculum sp. A6E488]